MATEARSQGNGSGMKHLRVMVVDDESIVRKDIRALMDWDAAGYELVAEASNGQATLHLLETERVDVIIADIQMPVMDGLQLAAAVLSKRKDVRFIFLTAYSSFEFARASLRLGVDSYILKHELSAQVLLTELDRIRDEMDQSNRKRAALMNEAMHSLLFTSMTDAACTQLLDELSIAFRPGASLLMQLKASDPITTPDWQTLAAEVLASVNVHCDMTGSPPYAIDAANLALLLTPPEGIAVGQARMEAVQHYGDALQEDLRQAVGQSVFILISEPMGAPSDISVRYQTLRRQLDRLFFYREPCVILCTASAPDAASPDDVLSRLTDLVERREFVDAERVLRTELTERLAAQQDMPSCQKCLGALLGQIADQWNARYAEENGTLDSVELYHQIMACANLYDASSQIGALLLQMRSMQLAKRKKRINVIKDYLRAHYTEDISLQMLAAQLGISEAYMSQLFRQQMGTSFKTYLREMRMKKAGELLLSGETRLQDISEKLGYSSVQYFCMVFKQYYGMTPGEYIRRFLRP